MKSTRGLQCFHFSGKRPRRMSEVTGITGSCCSGVRCCRGVPSKAQLATECQMLSWLGRFDYDKMTVEMCCEPKSQELELRELADFDRMPSGQVGCSHVHRPRKSPQLAPKFYRNSNLVFISLIFAFIAKHSVTTTQAIMPTPSITAIGQRQHSWHRHRDERTGGGGQVFRSPVYRSVNDEEDTQSTQETIDFSRQQEQPVDSDETKILALHKQLNALRRQLERALRKQQPNNNNNELVEPRLTHQPRPTRLGSPCLATGDCVQSVRFSHCKLDTFTCSCLDQHVELNSTSCLPPALLGYECTLDAQCQQKVPDSVCQLGKCACRSTGQLVAYRNNKCLPAARINDYCLADGQCQLNDKHSFCKWKIPNVYGTCKCPPNYKLLPEDDNDNLRVRCVPRLGDTCLSDHECQLATKNSICQIAAQSTTTTTKDDAIVAKHTTTPRRRNSWRSSSASAARCTCASGFVWSPSQLECLEAKDAQIDQRSKDSDNKLTTTTTQALDSHKYETVIAKEEQQQHNSPSELEIKFVPLQVPPSTIATSTTTTTTTTERPPSSITTTTTPVVTTHGSNATITGKFRMSSLGQACSSRQECQARDPYSDCIGGICECQAPSERCRASSTGCHPGTFQCRNGQCISWYFVCDQFRNCDDGSDEEACHSSSSSSSSSSAGCPPESFRCHSGGACLTRGKVCNGKRDCSDGSDEFGCSEPPAAAGRNSTGGCPANTFTCYNGQCLPAYVFCNAVEDCADASDEDERLCGRGIAQLTPESTSTQSSHSSVATTTTTTTTTTSKPRAQHTAESPLVKTDRASIERLMAALALTQRTPDKRGRKAKMVADKETLTATTTTTTSTTRPTLDAGECPRWAFTCRNGKCRSSAILCSGVDGCGDNSDEDRCEVCQCEPPPAPPAKAKPQRAALARRRHESSRRGELDIIRHAPNVAHA